MKRKFLIAPVLALALVVPGLPAGSAYADALAIAANPQAPTLPYWCMNVNGSKPDTGWIAYGGSGSPTEAYGENDADTFKFENGKLKTRDKTNILYINVAAPPPHPITGSMKAKGKLDVGGKAKAIMRNKTDKTRLVIKGTLFLVADTQCHSGVGTRPAGTSGAGLGDLPSLR